MRVLAIGMLGLCVTATPAAAQLSRGAHEYSGMHAPIGGDIRLPAPVNPTVARGTSVSREVRDIRAQVDAGRASGQLSRREARALRRESRRIEATSRRYASGGYSDAELAMLRSRSEALRSAVVAKRTQPLAGR
ncbi:hypothetical protein MZO42_20060 [Sphingomonas psychrotolerans]|uniref:DUF4148 domain-containing protein n=1 Tax=Sphingomonas psychrotolerans TaxID=1327635 RepID=A0ABU3NC26_9SPHN|nr:hypothetical protein [Sphingomonas psychrotolerans]MDT8761000.1 hypothetical protein [Sphingomonas psychrotolerans]